MSILRQYMDTLEDQKVMPQKLRLDRGTKTPLVAAAHHALRENINPNTQFADCYWFGTSVAN
jgi:hypothetical protein